MTIPLQHTPIADQLAKVDAKNHKTVIEVTAPYGAADRLAAALEADGYTAVTVNPHGAALQVQALDSIGVTLYVRVTEHTP